jgi:hypothetical protein
VSIWLGLTPASLYTKSPFRQLPVKSAFEQVCRASKFGALNLKKAPFQGTCPCRAVIEP